MSSVLSNPDSFERSSNPTVSYAGNPPYGLIGWGLALFALAVTSVLALLTSSQVSEVLPQDWHPVLTTALGWSLVAVAVIVPLRVLTAILPPRAWRLWGNRTSIGKFGRKFARNWRRIAPKVSPTAAGVVVSRQYPGFVSAHEEHGALVVTLRWPSERPSTDLISYIDAVAADVKTLFRFECVEARPDKLGWDNRGRFRLLIVPTDMTNDARTWKIE